MGPNGRQIRYCVWPKWKWQFWWRWWRWRLEVVAVGQTADFGKNQIWLPHRFCLSLTQAPSFLLNICRWNPSSQQLQRADARSHSGLPFKNKNSNSTAWKFPTHYPGMFLAQKATIIVSFGQGRDNISPSLITEQIEMTKEQTHTHARAHAHTHAHTHTQYALLIGIPIIN